MNFIPYIAIWAVLAVAVLGLALYRRILTFHGDDEFVHLTAAGFRGLRASAHTIGADRR